MIQIWAHLFESLRPKTLLNVGGGLLKIKTKQPIEAIVLTDEFVPFHGVGKTGAGGTKKTPMQIITGESSGIDENEGDGKLAF